MRDLCNEFLLYYPLKQGLKPIIHPTFIEIQLVFTLLSIKTRIETIIILYQNNSFLLFLLYYPLKQGLKQWQKYLNHFFYEVFLLYYPLKQGLKLLICFEPHEAP